MGQGAARRQEVEGTAGLNTASFDGYMKGLNAQGNAYQIASNMYPTTPTGHLQNLNALYGEAGNRERDRAEGITDIISPWAVYAQGKVEGSPNTKKQDRITP